MIDRKFGVELEIVGISKEQAIRALAAVDIIAYDAGYTHMTTLDWKVVDDSSVLGGFEVVSPVLEGEAGLETLRTAAHALADAGATANRSCGLHVHIDAHGMTVENIRTIVCRYASFEEEIDAFMPPSRRGNTNGYCYSVRQVAENEAFRSARTVAQLATAQPLLQGQSAGFPPSWDHRIPAAFRQRERDEDLQLGAAPAGLRPPVLPACSG